MFAGFGLTVACARFLSGWWVSRWPSFWQPGQHGERVMLETQEYVQGALQSSGTFSCLYLSKASTVVGEIDLGEADHCYP
jgi:hypothetical protein